LHKPIICVINEVSNALITKYYVRNAGLGCGQAQTYARVNPVNGLI